MGIPICPIRTPASKVAVHCPQADTFEGKLTEIIAEGEGKGRSQSPDNF